MIESQRGSWSRRRGAARPHAIAMLVGAIIICGGLFIFNSASTRYTTASYRAPPALNNVPIMTPGSVPSANTAPVQ